MTDKIPAMPELPEPVANVSASNPISGIGFVKPDKPYYTADQMRARDAMWAERLAALQSAQPAGVSDAEISRLWSWSATAEAERTATTQQHAFAYALLALRPQAVPMTWELLTDERIRSEDFSGVYWLALKNGTVTPGHYQWRQGHSPYGFNTEEQGRISASDVSHIAPLAEPAHPGITQRADAAHQTAKEPKP